MASLNRVMILGNLGKDPELRFTPTQQPVCTLRVATTDYRTDAQGTRQEQTEWHNVVVWGKQAEHCQQYLTKGRTVLVEGRIHNRSWEDKATGQKRYATDIVANMVRFVGSPRNQASATDGQGVVTPAPVPAFGGTAAPSIPASESIPGYQDLVGTVVNRSDSFPVEVPF